LAEHRLRAADFARYVVEPRGELYRLLMRYASAFMGIVAHVAACNAHHSAEQRLAVLRTRSCSCDTAIRNGVDDVFR
jgi:hypothetical protein